MADDARILIAAGFDAEEVRRIERAAMRESMVPIDWLRYVAREVTDDLERRQEERAEEGNAVRPGAVTVDEAEPDSAVAVSGEAPILARLDRLQRTLDEVCVWAQTLLSELYAHTGFADAETERVAREKAIAKFERIKAGVDDMRARRNGAEQ